MPERDANQLAADAAKWASILRNGSPGWLLAPEKLPPILDDLVGLVGTLTEKNNRVEARLARIREEDGLSDLFARTAAGYEERDARIAELEVEVATTRQALTAFLESHPHTGTGLLPTPCVCALCEAGRRALADTQEKP